MLVNMDEVLKPAQKGKYAVNEKNYNQRREELC